VLETVELLLLTRPGCHLCDDARAVVEQVRARLDAGGIATSLDEKNILEDAELTRRHAEDIPVLFVNGRRHATWMVDPVRLTAAVETATERGRASRTTGGAP